MEFLFGKFKVLICSSFCAARFNWMVMNCTSNLVISSQLLGHSLCNLSINSETHKSVDSCLQWNTISICNINYIKAGKKYASPTCYSGIGYIHIIIFQLILTQFQARRAPVHNQKKVSFNFPLKIYVNQTFI